MVKSSLILVGLLMVLSPHVHGACKNLLNNMNKYMLLDPDGNPLKEYNMCATLIKDHPILCDSEIGQEDGQCCKICANKDTSCIDNTLMYYVVNGQSMTCAEYVKEDPCRCEDSEVEGRCCRSCKKARCKKCRDYLSENQWIDLFDSDNKPKGKLTDCATLVKDHLYLCADKYGKEGGHCCESCSKKDLSCIDESVQWEGESCADYVAGDPCRCENKDVARTCCASCRGQVCPACRDYLSVDQWINVLDSDGNVMETLTDCATLVKDHLYFCDQKYGKEGGHCCASCSNQDLTCIDENVYWLVGDEEQYCAEYVSGDPCRCEQQNVAKKCCASCEGAVCEPCRDYLSEQNWVDVKDPDGNVVERLTDCNTLIDSYLYLCNKKYGQEGGQCCDSCSDQDMQCIDDGTMWIVDGGYQDCADYVGEDPCRCDRQNVAKKCCASCKGAVCDTCQDYLSEDTAITVTDKDGTVVERLTDCKALTDGYLYLCKGETGMKGGHCCESCSAIDLSCIDDTSVTWIMDGNRYTCSEYVKERPNSCNNANVKSRCCQSCKDGCVDVKIRVTIKMKVGKPKKPVVCAKCSCAGLKGKGEEFLRKACKKQKIKSKCCATCKN